MRYEIIERKDHEFSDHDFREYAKLCNGEAVDIVLDAAVEYIETRFEISLRDLKVIAWTGGGEIDLPFRKVVHIDDVRVVSGHGVPMGGVAHRLAGRSIILPQLSQCLAGAHYEIKYRTNAADCGAVVALAVHQVALDLYDGEDPRDVSGLLSGVAGGRVTRFLKAVGGTSRRIQ